MSRFEQWMEEERIRWAKPTAHTPVYLRFGMWGQKGSCPRSINFALGHQEKGLSVYRAKMARPGVVTLATDHRLIHDAEDCAERLNGRFIFAVTGREVGTGSDGEPVIVAVRMLPYAIAYDELPGAYRAA